jgi:hypothetical protein
MLVEIWLKLKNNKMKFTSKVLMFAASAGLFLTACSSGGGNSKNGLYYNNYTGADTEGYEFIKTVSAEANYQQLASARIGNPQLAEEIKKTYAGVAKDIHDLGDREKVLTPDLADTYYVADSNEVAKLIKSQELIVSQFKRVLHNTNVNIAEYAKNNLPKIEELLSKTKSGK